MTSSHQKGSENQGTRQEFLPIRNESEHPENREMPATIWNWPLMVSWFMLTDSLSCSDILDQHPLRNCRLITYTIATSFDDCGNHQQHQTQYRNRLLYQRKRLEFAVFPAALPINRSQVRILPRVLSMQDRGAEF